LVGQISTPARRIGHPGFVPFPAAVAHTIAMTVPTFSAVTLRKRQRQGWRGGSRDGLSVMLLALERRSAPPAGPPGALASKPPPGLLRGVHPTPFFESMWRRMNSEIVSSRVHERCKKFNVFTPYGFSLAFHYLWARTLFCGKLSHMERKTPQTCIDFVGSHYTVHHSVHLGDLFKKCTLLLDMLFGSTFRTKINCLGVKCDLVYRLTDFPVRL
jgi:hypothetical protein